HVHHACRRRASRLATRHRPRRTPAAQCRTVLEHPALCLLPPCRGKISGRRRPLEAPRSLTPLEARRALFDKGPDAFPGVLRFTADVLRECFKFQGSPQSYVLVVV